MAQKVQITFVDDFGDGPASETVSFKFDGVSYEIDLSSRNAEQFRKALGPYIKHARRVKTLSQRRGTLRAGPGREHASEIRAWARARGHKVSERGRIPAEIVEEYETAGSHTHASRPPGPSFTGSPGPDFGDDDE